MRITQDMVATFTYDGTDDMIDLDVKKVPEVSKNFKANLKLKNKMVIEAPTSWRNKIWKWWYLERKNELIKRNNRAMVDVANSMLNQKHKIAYNKDDL